MSIINCGILDWCKTFLYFLLISTTGFGEASSSGHKQYLYICTTFFEFCLCHILTYKVELQLNICFVMVIQVVMNWTFWVLLKKEMKCKYVSIVCDLMNETCSWNENKILKCFTSAQYSTINNSSITPGNVKCYIIQYKIHFFFLKRLEQSNENVFYVDEVCLVA